MQPHEPTPVKLFCGVLHSDAEKLEQALLLLAKYGRIDWQSKPFLFEQTDYYVAEMGSPIYRLFITFEELIPTIRRCEKPCSNAASARSLCHPLKM